MAKRTYETCGRRFTSRKKADRYARNIAKYIRVPVYETTGCDAPQPRVRKADKVPQ